MKANAGILWACKILKWLTYATGLLLLVLAAAYAHNDLRGFSTATIQEFFSPLYVGFFFFLVACVLTHHSLDGQLGDDESAFDVELDSIEPIHKTRK